jgi:hypothetical protein
VRTRSAAGTLSLLRQGLTLGVDYGTRSVGALLAVAEAVEQAVYEAGSLRRIPDGLTFVLENPPLRVGAFAEVRALIGGAPVPAESLRFRKRAGTPWRTGADVTEASPYEWGPGEATEFVLAAPPTAPGERVCVRLELRSTAVPPLVWCEIREVPATEGPAP